MSETEGSSANGPGDDTALAVRPRNGQLDSREDRLDEIFFVLKNRRRRKTLEYLYSVGGETDFRALVVAIAAYEADCDPEELTYKQRKSVHTSLYQVHLPALEDAGVLEYDRRSGKVRLTEAADDYRGFLRSEPEADDRPGCRYVVAAMAGVVGASLLSHTQLHIALVLIAGVATMAIALGVGVAVDR